VSCDEDYDATTPLNLAERLPGFSHIGRTESRCAKIDSARDQEKLCSGAHGKDYACDADVNTDHNCS
jgi:hypothetical protein